MHNRPRRTSHPAALPLHFVLYPITSAVAMLVRRWRTEDARRCRRCPTCTADHARDGHSLCAVFVPADLSPDELAGFVQLPGLRVVTADDGPGVSEEPTETSSHLVHL